MCKTGTHRLSIFDVVVLGRSEGHVLLCHVVNLKFTGWVLHKNLQHDNGGCNYNNLNMTIILITVTVNADTF